MTAENSPPDPYEAVISDLRAKRELIDQTIRNLEAMRSGASAPLAAGPVVAPSQVEAPTAEGPNAFLGMSIPEATKKLLGARRQALTNSEIAAALKAGGLYMQSRDPMNTIGSVITRRFEQVGDIVKVGRGTWGLAEWYPNRSWKKKPAKGEAATSSATSEPAQLSELTPAEPQG